MASSDAETAPAWVALISTDADLRSSFHRIVDSADVPAALALAIDCPFSAVTESELQELRRADPEFLVVDLESDPEGGLEFIRSLSDSGHAPGIVAVGSDLSQEILLRALQSGVKEMLPKPLDPEQVAVAIERMHRRGARAAKTEDEESPGGRVIALLGAKGGVGTTALATNLAVEIRRITGERTLLLDLDIEQGETALLLGMDPQLGLLDLLANFQPEVSDLLAACIDHDDNSGIDLLAAPLQPNPVQGEDLELLSGESMRSVLSFLRKHYTYVVVDRPKSFNPAFDCVLEEADEVYLVTTPDLQALRNITRSTPLLRRIAAEGGEDVRLVVNRYPAHPTIALGEIEDTVGLEVFHSLAADFFPLNESIHERTPAVLRESSQFARDVKALAAKITGAHERASDRKSLIGGFLGAIRNR